MALENAKQKAKREALEALPRIVAATQSEVGYAFVTEDIIVYLEKNKMVECDRNTKDSHGAVACRATEEGINTVNPQNAKGSETNMSEEKTEIVIETGVFEKPKSNRGGVGNQKYPFDKLEVGQSFFLAGKEAVKMGGTVSSANKRFAVEVKDENGEVVTRKNRKGATVPKTEQTRKFECYDAVLQVEGKPDVKGVRIGRVK